MKTLRGKRGAWGLCAPLVVIALSACSTAGDETPPDAMTLHPDGAAVDLGTGGGSAILDAPFVADATPVGPSAPLLSSPQPQSKLAGVLDVTGVAEPGADVIVKVTLDTDVLVQRTLVAGSDGAFSVNLAYRGVGHQQSFVVEVVQVTPKGASPATRVTVVHDVPYSITGTLSQMAGSSLKGTKVIVRLYRNADIAHVLDYVAEQSVDVAADNLVTASFSLPAAAGPYWVRAFRDSFGPGGQSPDQQPTFGLDAQAIGTVSVTNAITNTANLVLRGADSGAERYEGFNVMYNNVTPQPFPPSIRVGDKRLVGKGLCLGFFADSSVSRIGPGTNISKPWLKLPSGQIVEMKDDGACSESVRDNSGASFDETAGDNKYRFGIADPDERSEGVFAFFYSHVTSGHIHIQTDELKAKLKIPLLREIVSPDGSTTVKTLKPKITWKAVPGAKVYQAHLRALSGSQGGWDNSGQLASIVTLPEYSPDTDLPDNTCFELVISAFDANPFNEDVDAVAYAQSHSFCVDVDGSNTVELTGSITNKTSQNYPVMMRFGSSNGAVAVTTRLPANATSYKVAMLADALNDAGLLNAFIDRAGSGLSSSLENQGYEVTRDKLKLGASRNLPIVFNPRVVALTPTWFGDAPAKPKFTWEDYAVSAGDNKPTAPYVYAVWVGAEATGFPPLIYVLPSTTTSFDLANAPSATEALDVQALSSCLKGGGTFSTNAAANPLCTGASQTPSLKELAPSSLYVWEVIVLDCNFAQLVHPAKSTPAPDANPFLTCVQQALTDGVIFAQSAATPFFVK